jgi:hypothetical protein
MAGDPALEIKQQQFNAAMDLYGQRYMCLMFPGSAIKSVIKSA